MVCKKERSITKRIRPCKKEYSAEDVAEWYVRYGHKLTTYTPRSLIRSISGVVCIAIGISTLWLPSGSVVLIILGSGLLGYDVQKLYNRIKYELHLIKVGYL